MERGGEGGFGETVGRGWMTVGPYFAMRYVSLPPIFEGRSLCGRVSNGVETLALDGGEPRSASFHGERWTAEGQRRGDASARERRCADFLDRPGHALDELEPFPACEVADNLIDGRTVALAKLQVGVESDISFETARRDLLLRPGLRFVTSDAGGGAWALEEDGGLGLGSRGRIDFETGYRLGDGFVLGFESFCSGLGRNEFESCGAGLDPRLEF